MDASYDITAEFHEVFMPPAWDPLRDPVNDIFGDIGPDGVIVDIGAGSGMGTVTLAEVSDAEIIALEPNTTMRSMMVARLDQAGVLERVTILPGAVPEGLDGLPDRVDGVVATAMIGHLADAARTSLLDWIATSLAPGRTALLTLAASAEVPAEGIEFDIPDRTVGRHVYRVTGRILPGRVEGIFEVIDQQQQVIRSVSDTPSWETVTADDVRASLADHPVEVTEPQPGVALISKLSE